MEGQTVALSLENVSKNYGALRAIRDVSFEIMSGERRALIGPNGAGKTTLFHLISGVIRVSAGRIALFGTDITDFPTDRRVAFGMARTFQITSLFSELTVLENLILSLQALERTKFRMLKPLADYAGLQQKARTLLQQWQLDGRTDIAVKELSYGEQRTLEILLGIAQHPRLLLLDEPTAGLSPAESILAAELISKLPREVTIMLIEHDMDVAMQICDSVTVLHFGEVLASGSKEQIRDNPRVQEIYLGAPLDGASFSAAT